MNSRQNRIVEMLTANGEVFVQDLSERLEVTTMTIRRDLDLLENEGLLIRTHGGAVISSAGIIEFSFKKQSEECALEKQAIAKEAAALVEPGMTVVLDTGTTVLEVAKAIGGKRDLKVLTSSLVIASTLYARDNVELVLLGGRARRGNPDLTGWLTEENLKHFRVDTAVLGADGTSRDGVFTSDESVARVSQAMITAAARTILVADHTKFGGTAFLRYATWEDFDYVVTDAQVEEDAQRWLRRVAKNTVYARA